MKELSIEEKAKRYDEAIEALGSLFAEQAIKHCDRVNIKDITNIFPELKESEDEDIRKSIIGFLITIASLKDGKTVSNEDFDSKAILKWVAWLEKQGEHAKFRDSIQVGDKVTRNKDGVLVNLSQLNRVAKKGEKQGEQKPADKVDSNLLTVERAKEMSPFMMSSFENESAAWSEEDEDKFNQICSCVEAAPSDVCYYSRETLENWLKSLRHQTTWKPSDEQINALAKNVEYVNVGCTQSILKALLEDLKKLMEE